MSKTRDESLKVLKEMKLHTSFYGNNLLDSIDVAISDMEKISKIERIFKSASYIENNKVYSYLYNPESRLEHIYTILNMKN